jgi:hypothetical protein
MAITALDGRYTGRKISASLSYVKVRGKGKMDSSSGEQDAFALSLPLPPRTSAGWPATCVFVTVNEARRYLAAGLFWNCCDEGVPRRAPVCIWDGHCGDSWLLSHGVEGNFVATRVFSQRLFNIIGYPTGGWMRVKNEPLYLMQSGGKYG